MNLTTAALAGIVGLTTLIFDPEPIAAQKVEMLNSQEVMLDDNNQTMEEQGNGRDFSINGNTNRVRISGETNRLVVLGNNNEIRLDHVGKISLLGTGNHVTYVGGSAAVDPQVEKLGSGNRVEQTKSVSDKSESQKDPGQSTAPAPADKVLSIAENAKDLTKKVDGESIVLSGNSNNAVFQGEADKLTIRGNSNNVVIDRVRQIHFIGNANRVTYGGDSGGRPELRDDGQQNDVETR
jgi:Protein of unknown function (DUF3060)